MNNVYEAERVWRVMITDGLIGTEVTYSLLVSIFVRCGRSELALDAYDEMIHKNISPRGMHDESSVRFCVCGKILMLMFVLFT